MIFVWSRLTVFSHKKRSFHRENNEKCMRLTIQHLLNGNCTKSTFRQCWVQWSWCCVVIGIISYICDLAKQINAFILFDCNRTKDRMKPLQKKQPELYWQLLWKYFLIIFDFSTNSLYCCVIWLLLFDSIYFDLFLDSTSK